MNKLFIIAGSQTTIVEDVQRIVDDIQEKPELIWIEGETLKSRVIEEASALFPKPGTLLVIVEPGWDLVEDLKEHLKTILERTKVIIHSSTSPPKSCSFEHTLTVVEAGRTFAEKERIRETRLREQVLRITKRYGKQMTDKAFVLFKERIHDESSVGLELEKVISYVGTKERIDSKDIKTIVTESHEDELYTLFEAFAAKDQKKTAALLDALLRSGMHLLVIQGYLLRRVRLLLHAKDLALDGPPIPYNAFQKVLGSAKDLLDIKPTERKNYLTSQKPFPAFKLYQVSQKISSSDLVALYLRLAEADIAIKSGSKHDRLFIEQTLLAQ